MPYLPIEDYGIIGDLHSVALVGINGSIDWCCLPKFDSPSLFGAILDQERGGSFKIAAENVIKLRQAYLPDTNILVTRSYTEGGLGQVENFMPLVAKDDLVLRNLHRIVRRVSCVRGTVKFTMTCQPAFDYARKEHQLYKGSQGVLFDPGEELLYGLRSPLEMNIVDGKVSAEFTLQQGEHVSFVFFCVPKIVAGDPFSHIGDVHKLFEATERYWHEWMKSCTYDGRWSEMVNRSALVLKLLTYEPTGAIVAAPTTALPERIGGERNWDYRFTWIRDASFTIYALMRIGFTHEAERFMDWVVARLEEVEDAERQPLQLMYTIDGGVIPKEELLTHLSGYQNSQPVRIGNAASEQLQLDIYGELLDALHLFNRYGRPITYKQWKQVRRLMSWLCRNWDTPDEGIWETRGGRKDFVYSRLMCWVALDRATRISQKLSLPGDVSRWITERDNIYDQIMLRGWNEDGKWFRQHYQTNALDAANLLMPLVKFISPVDPRMLSTIDATLSQLAADNLLFRYDPSESPDGLSGEEGTFCVCTFWLVECLTRAGRLNEARLIFQKMLSYANHVGLFGEEIGLHGETLGNFPQAFTHLGLISAAFNLDAALTAERHDQRVEFE